VSARCENRIKGTNRSGLGRGGDRREDVEDGADVEGRRKSFRGLRGSIGEEGNDLGL